MIKISVVMPVFNSESYLKESIGSILSQSLKDIEIICVDDGSTDDSLNILNKYESNNENMKVISQINKGPGGARNTGLKYAKGEYVYFIDSDDILRLDSALEELYRILKNNNLDLLIFPLLNYDNDTNEIFETKYFKMKDLYDSVGESIFTYKDISDILFSTCNSTCCKVYSKNFLLDNDISFPENLLFEANVFHFHVMLAAKKIYFYNKYLYLRRHREHSIITSADDRYMDCLVIYDILFDLFKDYNIFDKFKVELYNYMVFGIKSWFLDIGEINKDDFFKDIKKYLKKYNSSMEGLLYMNNSNFLENVLKAKSYDEYLSLVEKK